jgi:hypothetical protein
MHDSSMWKHFYSVLLYLLRKTLQAFSPPHPFFGVFNVFQQNLPTQQIDQLNTSMLKVLISKVVFCVMIPAIFSCVISYFLSVPCKGQL